LNQYYAKTKGGLGYFYGKAALLNPIESGKIFETSE